MKFSGQYSISTKAWWYLSDGYFDCLSPVALHIIGPFMLGLIY